MGCLGPRSACGKAEKFPELRPPRVDKGPCCVGKGCSRQRCPFAERRQGLPLIFDAVRFCIPPVARCPPVATSLHPFLQGTPEGSSASQILTLCRPMAAAGSGCKGFQGSLISLLEWDDFGLPAWGAGIPGEPSWPPWMLVPWTGFASRFFLIFLARTAS